MRKDHKVSFRTEQSVKVSANKARAILAPPGLPAFNVVECILKLTREPILYYDKLDLIFENRNPPSSPAYVTFIPRRTLHVDEDVWGDAQENIPEFRYVLAHELGHLVLHDHYAQPFSGEKSKAWQDEESAEWQADRFADHFLISDGELHEYVTPSAISNYCAVLREVALRRLGKQFRYTGECCPHCWNFTLVNAGLYDKCDVCASSRECVF